jgi:hypothetical protein
VTDAIRVSSNARLKSWVTSGVAASEGTMMWPSAFKPNPMAFLIRPGRKR